MAAWMRVHLCMDAAYVHYGLCMRHTASPDPAAHVLLSEACEAGARGGELGVRG